MSKSKLSGSKRANRVLILDDEPGVCRFIADVVEGLGFEAEMASDAALVYLGELKDSDIVFIDIQMPGMDGFQVLEVLSRRSARSGIILTSDTNEELMGAVAMAKERGLELIGALAKPLQVAQVRELLEMVD